MSFTALSVIEVLRAADDDHTCSREREQSVINLRKIEKCLSCHESATKLHNIKFHEFATYLCSKCFFKAIAQVALNKEYAHL